MGANDVEGRGQLIPELPEELVLARVVPRLPWYTRPVCRTLSKSWRALMDTRNPELDLQTRTIQLPLLRGLFLFCTFDKQIFISDPEIKGACRMNGYQVQPHWRKLPPVRSLSAPPHIRAAMVASSGMVYVWSVCAAADVEDGEEQTFVLKLDIGSADCTWKKCLVPYAFNADGVAFNDSIIVPRISRDLPSPRRAVLVHDMSTDICKKVEKWVPDYIRVLSRSTASGALVEEMYGLVEEDFPPTKLEVVMYDVGSDSWRTLEKVSLPKYLEPVKLLNAECFKPVPKTGTNLVWIDYKEQVISWFNSSVGSSWVYTDYTTSVKGMRVESIEFIRDSMYAIFLEQKDDLEDGKEEEEDGQGPAHLFKRVLMKRRIIVASNRVAWEEVHEIGFFDKWYQVSFSAFVRPIRWFTTMA